MNFMEAVKAMKEGKKVRQSKPNTTNYRFNKYGQIITEQGEIMCFGQDYYEATDWQIYEEEDNWNLTDAIIEFLEEKDYHRNSNFTLKLFSILKFNNQKVKEDIDNIAVMTHEDWKIKVNDAIDKRVGDLK